MSAQFCKVVFAVTFDTMPPSSARLSHHPATAVDPRCASHRFVQHDQGCTPVSGGRHQLADEVALTGRILIFTRNKDSSSSRRRRATSQTREVGLDSNQTEHTVHT